MNIFELSPATRLRIRQELANSTLTVGEIVEVLVIEALNARDAVHNRHEETRRYWEQQLNGTRWSRHDH